MFTNGEKMTHLIGTKRKFDGDYYKAVSSHPSKAKAIKSRDYWHRRGFKARIIPVDTEKYGLEYYVYRSR